MWLRTGRLPALRNVDGIEIKFNPWHDPDDGRFTFADTGRRYGKRGGDTLPDGGGGASGHRSGASARPTRDTSANGPAPASKASVRAPSGRGAWAGGGFTGGGGGSFRGGGASGRWGVGHRRQRQTVSHGSAIAVAAADRAGAISKAPAGVAHPRSDPFRTVVRNGYTFEIDPRGRTTRVSGRLTTTDTPIRSRTVQARAGGADRRPTDDGGHYVAARFRGPAEAINHVA